MYFLLVLLILVVCFLLFCALFPLKATAIFNSEDQYDVLILTTWLNPLFKGTIKRENDRLLLKLYVLNNNIYTKNILHTVGTAIKHEPEGYVHYLDLVKSLDLRHVKLCASYGSYDPSITGMICGTIDLFIEYLNPEIFCHNPDFSMSSDFINISFEADINIAVFAINLLKRRLHGSSSAYFHEAK